MKLSARVMDCNFGVPAADVRLSLWRQHNAEWRFVTSGYSGTDGQVAAWCEHQFQAGTYRLEIEIDGYYSAIGTMPRHSRAALEFRAFDPNADLHLEILIGINFFQVWQQTGLAADHC